MRLQSPYEASPQRGDDESEQKAPPDYSAHLYVKIKDQEVLRYTNGSLDRLCINKLEEMNLELNLVWVDPYQPDSVCRRTFKVPNFSSGYYFWDVCFFSFESQVEIGAFVHQQPEGNDLRLMMERFRDFIRKRK